MSNRHNARRAAVQALYQWDLTKQEVDEIEASFFQIHGMENVDRRYFKKLLRGITAEQDELKSMLIPFVERGLEKLDPVERAVLLVGSYELRYLTDVPTKVVLNETIELAKLFGAEHSFKFVNSVMDKLAAQERQ
ncbi:MAG: transcription antitermination factor NusB [Pseudomonadota bacterium]